MNAADVLEIRSAVNGARSTLGLPAASYSTTVAAGRVIAAVDVTETRAAEQ